MTDQRMPDRDQASEKSSRSEKEQHERASTPDQNIFDEHEAARRQARQDPLQKRDR
jgi:hypothetical protein